MKLDFNNKTFALLKNSNEGEAGKSTLFKYKQNGNLVTAVYQGGNVRFGYIIAVLMDSKLDMRYQCVTDKNELRSGMAIADVTLLGNGKIKLELAWEWIDQNNSRGTSTYIEL